MLCSSVAVLKKRRNNTTWVGRKRDSKGSRDLLPDKKSRRPYIYKFLSLFIPSLFFFFFFFRYWELHFVLGPHVERDCPADGPTEKKLAATFPSRVILKSHSDRCGRAAYYRRVRFQTKKKYPVQFSYFHQLSSSKFSLHLRPSRLGTFCGKNQCGQPISAKNCFKNTHVFLFYFS